MGKDFRLAFTDDLYADCMRNPVVSAVYLYLLRNATPKNKTEIQNGHKLDLEPGQLVFSRRWASEYMQIGERQVRNAISRLESEGIIRQQPTLKTNIITLINWHSYAMNKVKNDPQNSTDAKKCPQNASKNDPQTNINKSNSCDKKTPSNDPQNDPQNDPLNLKEESLRVLESLNTLSECLSPLVSQDADEPNSQSENSQQGSLVPEAPKRPKCPYKEIVALYHETLPDHPRVGLITKKREGNINARWGDVGKRLRELGKPDSYAARLEYFKMAFIRASKSDCLTGRITFKDGHTYIANFDKLVSPNGFIKLIEGGYDNERFNRG